MVVAGQVGAVPEGEDGEVCAPLRRDGVAHNFQLGPWLCNAREGVSCFVREKDRVGGYVNTRLRCQWTAGAGKDLPTSPCPGMPPLLQPANRVALVVFVLLTQPNYQAQGHTYRPIHVEHDG